MKPPRGSVRSKLRNLDPGYLTQAWRRARARGLVPNVTLHALRHTHASALIAQGADVVTVSRRLGHGSTTTTTSVYAHAFSKGDEAAAKAIDVLLDFGRGSVTSDITAKTVVFFRRKEGTMSGNLDVVHDGYSAFERGDIPGLQDLCDPAIKWVYHGAVPWVGEFQGHDGVARFFALLADTIGIEAFEPREFISEGDNVAVLGWELASVKGTGQRFENNWRIHGPKWQSCQVRGL
jgi:ketosteroid isomerase-like protein